MGSQVEEYDLPPDICIEILKRLPVKPMVRFMSVSKQWKSVIQSSSFISDYNNIQQQQQQQPSSFYLFFVGFDRGKYAIIKEKQTNILWDDDNISDQQFHTLHDSDDAFQDFNSCCKLIGHSQGLFGYYNFEDRLLIWNPSIKKSLSIPLPTPSYGAYDFHVCFTVVCNATEPRIFTITCTPRLRVQIYTLTVGDWRTVSNSPPRESLQFTGDIEVTDRFIYWIAYARNDDDSLNYVILSFDITSEQFTELCLPPALALAAHTCHTSLELSKLTESLVVLKIDTNKQEIGVWMMEPGGVENSFTKQFTINLPCWEYKKHVLGFTKDGQPILLMWDGDQWQLLLYEPGSKSFTNIGHPGKHYPHLAVSYMETLLLLDH